MLDLPAKLDNIIQTTIETKNGTLSIVEYVYAEVLGENLPTCTSKTTGNAETGGAYPIRKNDPQGKIPFVPHLEEQAKEFLKGVVNNAKVITASVSKCPTGTSGDGYTCISTAFKENKILGSIDDIILKKVIGAAGALFYKSTTPFTSKTFSLLPVGISELSDTASVPMETFATAFYLQFVFVFVGSACLLTFAYSWMNVKRVERKRSRKYKIPENSSLRVPMVGGVGTGLCGKRGCCEKKQKNAKVTRETVVPAQAINQRPNKQLSPITPAAAGAVQQVPGPMLYNTGRQTVS